MFLYFIYTFVQFIIIGNEANFWQAMEGSRKLVMKHFGTFIGLFIVLGLINFAGALFFFIGLIITVPLSYCTIYVIYKSIFGIQESEFDERISSFGNSENPFIK